MNITPYQLYLASAGTHTECKQRTHFNCINKERRIFLVTRTLGPESLRTS